MNRTALVALAFVVAALAMVGWMMLGPAATSLGVVASSDGSESPDLVGGFGDLSAGHGGGSSGSTTRTPTTVIPLLDAGAGAVDAGDGVPEPLAARPAPPSALPASIRFADARSVEDEYESATMVWSMIEVRRDDVRGQLAEARRIGDQPLSDRLARQLELLEIGDRRWAGIVHDLESRRGSAMPVSEDTAHAEGSEGASPR